MCVFKTVLFEGDHGSILTVKGANFTRYSFLLRNLLMQTV